jgi:hypothetical protein
LKETRRTKLIDLGDSIGRIRIERKMIPGMKYKTKICLHLISPSVDGLMKHPTDIKINKIEKIAALRDAIDDAIFEFHEIERKKLD